MENILVGTTNQAKVAQLAGALRPIGVHVRGLPEGAPLPRADEDGETAAENARTKALVYARTFGEPVLSMDNALYLEGLAPDEQPGVHVRRIGGEERPSDDALREHYASLVARLGGKAKGRWEFGICLAWPDGRMRETVIVSPRVFTAAPCAAAVPGYPLESLQIDPASGRYIAEMTQGEQDEFWQRAIGEPLQKFIKGIEP